MVRDFQVIQVPKYVHVSLGLRRLAQNGRQQQSSLPIQLHRLPVVARSHQELPLRAVRARHLRQLVLDFRPNLHRVNLGRLTGRAGDVKLAPILLQFLQKHGAPLQPAPPLPPSFIPSSPLYSLPPTPSHFSPSLPPKNSLDITKNHPF